MNKDEPSRMIGGNSCRPPERGPGQTEHDADAAPGLDWAADEPRWRREQRSRRRRLTQRGRATLASALFVSVVVLGWVVDPFSPVRAAARQELPPVSAGAPPVAQRADVGSDAVPEVVIPEVPEYGLERVPVTRAALALP